MLRFTYLLLFLVGMLALDAEAQGQTTPAAQPAKKVRKLGLQPDLIRGPYLQMATPTGMTIRWRTNAYDRSRVMFGTSPNQLSTVVDDSTLLMDHVIRLENLKPATKYFYAISNFADTIQYGKENYFYTLPETGKRDTYRIAALGDCGNNSTNQRLVRDELLKYLGDDYLNAWILLGDNAYSDGTDAEFQAKFFNVYKDDLLKKYPLFPSPGNHDYHDLESAGKKDQYKMAYFQQFTVPQKGEAGGVPSNSQAYYSFDIGNVHFISLDSYGRDEKNKRMYEQESAQVEWLKKDLEVNKNKEWVVAYWHHPPYTKGSHDSDTESLLVNIREQFNQVIEDYGVDLVLCGHSHVYERSKLMKGHFGPEASFNAEKHNLSASTGLYDGSKNSAPYLKSSDDTNGTVYVVSGSAGQLGGAKATYPHDAMYYSNNEVGGSLLLEVTGKQMDVKWICSDGKIRDSFTMMKNVKNKEKTLLKKDKVLTRSKANEKEKLSSLR